MQKKHYSGALCRRSAIGSFASWQKCVAVIVAVTVFFLDAPLYANQVSPTTNVSESLTSQATSFNFNDLRNTSQSFAQNEIDVLIENVPDEFGKVQDFFQGTSENTIIYLQDAHGQIDAQESLEGLLDWLNKEYGYEILFLEGGLPQEITSDYLKFTLDEKVNEQIVEQLFKEGAIGGPSHYLFQSQDAMKAYGIEERETYFDNLLSYRRVYSRNAFIKQFIDSYKTQLQTVASQVLSPKLLNFTKQWLAFQDNKQDMLRHLEALRKYAKEVLRLDLRNARYQIEYPQLVRFFKLKELEKRSDDTDFKAQAEIQKEELLDWLRSAQLDEANIDFFKLMVMAGDNPHSNKVPKNARKVLEVFYEAARYEGFTWDLYPHLNVMFAQMVLNQEMNGIELFTEIENITEVMMAKLAPSEEEQVLLEIYQDMLLLSRLWNLELTNENYDQLVTRQKSISPSEMVQRLRNYDARIPLLPKAIAKKLGQTYGEGLRFYRLAKKRDGVFLDQITSRLQQEVEQKAIFVSGGFHAGGMHALFRENQISYVSIQPHMKQLSSKDVYLDQMMLKPKWDPNTSTVATTSAGLMPIQEMSSAPDRKFHTSLLRRIFRMFVDSFSRVGEGPAFGIHGFGPQNNAPLAFSGVRLEARKSPIEQGLTGYDLNKVQYLVKEIKRVSGRDTFDYESAGSNGFDQIVARAGLGEGQETFDELPDSLPSERKDTVSYQADMAKRIPGLVKNAQDWSMGPDGEPLPLATQSGEYAEGAMRLLGDLRTTAKEGVEDYAVIETRANGGEGLRIWIWNVGGDDTPRYVMNYESVSGLTFTKGEKKYDHGTRITIHRKDFERDRPDFLVQSLRVNTRGPLNIYAGGKKYTPNQPANENIWDYVGPEGGNQVKSDNSPVDIAFFNDGYFVQDYGPGMSIRDFFEKFLVADPDQITEKKKARGAANTRDPRNVKVYSSKKKTRRTMIEENVHGHRIQRYEHPENQELLNLAERFIIDFPAGTPYPNDESQVELDSGARATLKKAIDRLTVDSVTGAVQEVSERFSKINSLAVYLRKKKTHPDDDELMEYLANRTAAFFELHLRNGRINDQVVVPNNTEDPYLNHGWKAFDNEAFLPIDAELLEMMDYQFQLSNMTHLVGEPLDVTERQRILGSSALSFFSLPMHVAKWDFQDKVENVVTIVLDDEGGPVILIDPRAFNEHGASRYLFEQLMDTLTPELAKLLALVKKKEKKNWEDEERPFDWKRELMKYISPVAIALLFFAVAAALSTWVFMPLYYHFFGEEDVDGDGDLSLENEELSKADVLEEIKKDIKKKPTIKPKTPKEVRTPGGAVKPRAQSKEAGEARQRVRQTQIPKNIKVPKVKRPQSQSAEQISQSRNVRPRVQVPGAAERRVDQPPRETSLIKRPIRRGFAGPFRAGLGMRDRGDPSRTNFKQLQRVRELMRMKNAGKDIREELAKLDVEDKEEDPQAALFPDEYGYILNPVMESPGSMEPLVTEYYVQLGEDGYWTPMDQTKVKKTLKDPNTPRLNQEDIVMSVVGYAQPGQVIGLYNYFSGIIPDLEEDPEAITVVQIDAEGNEVPGEVEWERQGDAILFKSAGVVQVKWKIDYYDAKDVDINLPQTSLPKNEMEDLKEHFPEELAAMENMSDEERVQYILEFLGENAVYDLYATRKQGAVSRVGSDSIAESMAKGMGRQPFGEDVRLPPGDIQGKAKMKCTQSCDATALLAGGAGSKVVKVKMVIPEDSGVFNSQSSGHARTGVYVEDSDFWLPVETTQTLPYHETPFDPNAIDDVAPAPAMGGLGIGGVPGKGIDPEKFKEIGEVIDHLKEFLERPSSNPSLSLREFLNAKMSVEKVNEIVESLQRLQGDSLTRADSKALVLFFQDLAEAVKSKKDGRELDEMKVKLLKESSKLRTAERYRVFDALLARLEEFRVAGLVTDQDIETLTNIRNRKYESKLTVYQFRKNLQELAMNTETLEYEQEIEEMLETIDHIDSYSKRVGEQMAIGEMIEALIDMAANLDDYGLEEMSEDEITYVVTMVIQAWQGGRELKLEDYYELNKWLEYLASAEVEHMEEEEIEGEGPIQKGFAALAAMSGFENLQDVRERLFYWETAEMFQTLDKEGVLDDVLSEEEKKEFLKSIDGLKDSDFSYWDNVDIVVETFSKLAKKPGLEETMEDLTAAFAGDMDKFQEKYKDSLTDEDAKPLSNTLVRQLDGLVDEEEVREWAEDFVELHNENSEKHSYSDSGVEQLFDVISALSQVEGEERLEAFQGEQEGVEEFRAKKRMDFLNFAMMGTFVAIVVSGIVFFISHAFYDNVKDDLQRKEHARREKVRFKGHRTPFDGRYDGWLDVGPRDPEEISEESMLYGKQGTSYDYTIRGVLPWMKDTSGRWGAPVEGVKKEAGRDVERPKSTRNVKLAGKVIPNQMVPLHTTPNEIVIPSTLKAYWVDGQGRRHVTDAIRWDGISSSIQVTENFPIGANGEGTLALSYEVGKVEPHQTYWTIPYEAPAQEELDAVEEHFGKRLRKYLKQTGSTDVGKMRAVNLFMQELSLQDEYATAEDGSLVRGDHETWIAAAAEQVKRNKTIRANQRTIVHIKALLLAHMGLRVARVIGLNGDSFRRISLSKLSTDLDYSEQLLVGFPRERGWNEGEEKKKHPNPIKSLDSDFGIEFVGFQTEELLEGDGDHLIWMKDDPLKHTRNFAPFPFPKVAGYAFWNIILPKTLRGLGIALIAIPYFIYTLFRAFIVEYFIYLFINRPRVKRILERMHVDQSHAIYKIVLGTPWLYYKMKAADIMEWRPYDYDFVFLKQIDEYEEFSKLMDLYRHHHALDPERALQFIGSMLLVRNKKTGELLPIRRNDSVIPRALGETWQPMPAPAATQEDGSYRKPADRRVNSLRTGFGLVAGVQLDKPVGQVHEVAREFSPLYLYLPRNAPLDSDAREYGEKFLELSRELKDANDIEAVSNILSLVSEVHRVIDSLQARCGSSVACQKVLPRMEKMPGRVFVYAVNELERTEKLENSGEIAKMLLRVTKENVQKAEKFVVLDEVWRFEAENKEDLDKYFPYPGRELVEFFLGYESLFIENDEDLEAEAKAPEEKSKVSKPENADLVTDAIRVWLNETGMSLAWLTDAADVLSVAKQDVDGIDSVQEAVIRAFKRTLEGYFLGTKKLVDEDTSEIDLRIEYDRSSIKKHPLYDFYHQCVGDFGCGIAQMANAIVEASPRNDLNIDQIQKALARAFQAAEPKTRDDLNRAIRTQKQPGLVMLRELIQNARDITRGVKDEDAKEKLKRFGGKKQVRIRSFLNRNEEDKRKKRQRWIRSVEDSHGMDEDIFVKVFFPPKATTKSPAKRVEAILKNELPDNLKVAAIMDAFVKEEHKKDAALRDKVKLIVEGRAGYAHPEEDILTALNGFRSKESESAGFFGVGNYTAYHDSDEVVVRTGFGGKIYYARLKPVKKTITRGGVTEEVVVDIEILDFKTFEDPESEYEGTLVQSIKYVEEGQEPFVQLADREMKYLFMKYVGSVDDVELVFADEKGDPRDIPIHDKREALASYGAVTTMTSERGIPRVTVDQLYIEDPGDTEALFAHVPEFGKDYLHRNHINFEFRKGTRVTQARAALLYPNDHSHEVAVVSLKTFAGAWQEGRLRISGLGSYEGFLRDPKTLNQGLVLDEQVVRDAAAINAGQSISVDRWKYYKEDQDAYAALLVRVNTITQEGGTQTSAYAQKQQLFFSNLPNGFDKLYERNQVLRNAVDQLSTSGFAATSSQEFRNRVTYELLNIVTVLYAKNQLTLPAIDKVENYMFPDAEARTPDAAVVEDIQRLRNIDESARVRPEEVDFEKYRSVQRLLDYVVALPLASQENLNEIKERLPQVKRVIDLKTNEIDKKRVVKYVASETTRELPVERDDYKVLDAFGRFLDSVTGSLEERLPASHQRVFKVDGIDWEFVAADQEVLPAFYRFMLGDSDEVFEHLFTRFNTGGQRTPQNLRAYYAGLLRGPNPGALRQRVLSQVRYEDADTDEFATLLDSFEERNRRVVFNYERNESREVTLELEPVVSQTPRFTTTSFTAQLDVATAMVGIVGTGAGRLASRLHETLHPEKEERILSVEEGALLQQAIRSSAAPLSLVVSVPAGLNANQIQGVLDGIFVGLDQEVAESHQVIVVVEGDSDATKTFKQSFSRLFDTVSAERELKNPQGLRSRIEVKTVDEFQALASILLFDRNVGFVGTTRSELYGIDLSSVGRSYDRIVTDRLATGENLGLEERDYIGNFVVGGFETLLLQADPISEKTRFLIQGEDEDWYARSREAVTGISAFITAMLETSLLTEQSA